MAQVPVQVSSVTIGAPNPREMAAFYQRLLGWIVSALEDPLPGDPPEAGWAQLRFPRTGPA
jgi:catechol 2,3-dioxygenase-like lactoylglutathione lyase family enzyme